MLNKKAAKLPNQVVKETTSDTLQIDDNFIERKQQISEATSDTDYDYSESDLIKKSIRKLAAGSETNQFYNDSKSNPYSLTATNTKPSLPNNQQSTVPAKNSTTTNLTPFVFAQAPFLSSQFLSKSINENHQKSVVLTKSSSFFTPNLIDQLKEQIPG